MLLTTPNPHSVLAGALAADQRSADIPAEADLYGWLVGSWDLDVRFFLSDVSGLGLRGEAHFGWVLEGRAVQDVWIMPHRPERTPAPDRIANMYGTTLRAWDPCLQAWRVTWTDPVTGGRDQLIGRRVGDRIVQLGTHADGTPIRWIFSEISDDSFRWTGEALQPDGETWALEGEFRATRIR